jgi:ferredoxin
MFKPAPKSKRLDYQALRSFRSDPAKFITETINDYVNCAPTNWSVPFQHPFFSAPVAIAFGDGDSQDFLDIKRRYPWTLTPRECLDKPPAVQISTVIGGLKSGVRMPAREFMPVITEKGEITWPKGEPPLPPWPAKTAPQMATNNQGPMPLNKPSEHVTCISIGFPIHPDILKAETSYPLGNSPEHKVHSLFGAHVGFIRDASLYLNSILEMFGYKATAPTFTPWGQESMMDFQYEGNTSRDTISPCAERQWAVASGLGTFGLPDMIITEKGMAVILTTIMCSAQIPPSPKPTKEYCLYYRNGSCKKCISRCPGQAISEKGRLAARCDGGAAAAAIYNLAFLKDRMTKELGDYADVSIMPLGKPSMAFTACGRCYTGVPCSTEIPS